MSDMLSPRPYQLKQLEAIEAGAARGLTRVLVQSPTGTGKTVTFAQLLRRRAGRALVFAHRDELIQQTAEKVRLVCKEFPGIVKADQNNLGQRVTIASVQTLQHERRIAPIAEGWAGTYAGPLATVIVDEAHHATGINTYAKVLQRLGAMDDGTPTLTVGFTATAFRGDEAALGDVFQEIVYERPIVPFIAEGWLVNVRAKQIRLDMDYEDIAVSRGDFQAGSAGEVLMEAGAPEYAAEAYVQEAADRKAVVFTPTVAVSREVERCLRERGVSVAHLDGETPQDERRSILDRVENGDLRVVTNCNVLTEGWDSPSVSCVILIRPTKSRVLYTQMVGRVLRPHPQSGKKDALILDLVGNASRLSIMNAATLFGVEPKTLEKKGGLMEALQEVEARRVILAKLAVEEVQLFDRSDLHWNQDAPAGKFILSLGIESGNLVVRRTASGLYEIEHVWRAFANSWAKFKTDFSKKLYAELSLDVAMSTAESYVREHGDKSASILNDPKAAWRSHPASEGQIRVLRKKRLWRDGMTKGEASDLLNRIFTK